MSGLIFVAFILLFSKASVTNCQDSGELLTYSATIEMGGTNAPLMYRRTFERKLWSETLLLRPDSAQDQLITVSNKKLTTREFNITMDAWQLRKLDFRYFRLSCSLFEAIRSSLCFCTRYVKRANNNNDDTSSTEPEWQPLKENISLCNRIPRRLGKGVFDGMANLEVIDVENVELTGIEGDTFLELPSLKLIRLSSGRVSVDQNASGLFCGLSQPIAVQISNATLKQRNGDEFSGGNELIRLFDCDAGRPVEGSEEAKAKIFVLEINRSGITRLDKDAFHWFDTQYVMSVSFSANEINIIDNETFCGFSNVAEIDLSYNRLDSLEFLTLPDLGSLRSLSLAFNAIQTVHTSVFAKMISLRTLNLSGNCITDIDGGFGMLPILIYLDLAQNKLSVVNAIVLDKCYQLAKLWLNDNRIGEIHANAFRSTLFLKFLHLSNNLLSNETMVRDFLQFSLQYLEILQLAQNNLIALLPYMFKAYTYQSSLYAIDLTGNQIEVIDKDAFIYHSSLRALMLGVNRIRKLDGDTFRTNQQLMVVHLSRNLLTDLPGSLFPDSLGELYLANNFIGKLPLFNKTMPKLTVLTLHGNNVSEIGADAFSRLPALQALNVSNCSALELSPYAFVNRTQLYMLDLSQNSLDLDFSINYLAGSPKISFLNLSHNNIRSGRNLFLHNIRYSSLVDVSHNPMSVLPDQPKKTILGQNVILTERLLMRNCSLHSVHRQSLELAFYIGLIDFSDNNLTEFQPLEISDLVGDYRYQVLLDNNPIKCSCQMKWLTDIRFASHYNVSYCRRTLTGTMEPFKLIPEQEFLCNVTEFCTVDSRQCTCFAESATSEPTVVDCHDRGIENFPRNIPLSTKVVHFQGNELRLLSRENLSAAPDNLIELYLDNNRIDTVNSLAFASCPKLLILGLSGNRIKHLKLEMFSNLKRLHSLFLHGNLIQEIDSLVFQPHRVLAVLTLHENSLRFLTDDNMDDLTSSSLLDRLSLHENPWDCRCDNATFKYWIQQHQALIENVTDITCNGTAVLRIPDESLLCYSLRLSVTEFHYFFGPLFAVCTLAAIGFVSLFLLYRHRYVLQVLVYNRFDVRRNQAEDESCAYDAIAIYDSASEAVRRWIKDALVERLEPAFRLYIPDRDMEVGGAKCEEIVEGIKRSKRTILVLSTEAEEQEILFAFDAANHRVTLERSYHRLILVLLEGVRCKDLLQKPDLNANLKAYLITRQYVSVTDKLFWKKLIFFLPRPAAELSFDSSSSSEPPIYAIPGPGETAI